MKQPTPEEWWNGLDEDDRRTFSAAAHETFLSPELAAKLTKANVLFVMGGFNNEMNVVFPGPYREYAAARGDDAE